LKEKIQEFINDYYVDLKKYLKKIRKIINRYYRKLKYIWNHPKSQIGKKVIPKINTFFHNLSNIFENVFLKSEYRKRNLLVVGFLIIFGCFLLILMPSFAFYQNKYEFDLLSGVVGDMYASKFDYSLLIYVEETNELGEGSGRYNLTSEIPTFGFSYSGYKCNNNSVLTYDETSLNTSVTLNQKDICSVYFDLISDADIGIQIMLEESIASNSYKLADFLPYYGYQYSHYECDNNSTLTYDSNLHKINVQSTNQDYCRVYFKKDEADINVRLFVENTYGEKDYVERLSIPSNKEYVLNSESVCFNNNNERLETDISYTDGYVLINPTSISYCQVYLDLANE